MGFYDLREAASSAVPVVSTAFRPIEADELALDPFRVFTSMLTPADPRFFDPELRAQLEEFLSRRELSSPELLSLADRAEKEPELPEHDAERFLDLAVGAFRLSGEPVERAWYERLEKVSAVAADIGGVRSTHINHLTPRVLDIDELYRRTVPTNCTDELYRRMSARGIEMIDAIQGPAKWEGPDILLRQKSFRALAEPRTLREPDGRVTGGALRVRFGEVEARGIALTRQGRAVYDTLLAQVDRNLAASPGKEQDDAARRVCRRPRAACSRVTSPSSPSASARTGQAASRPETSSGSSSADVHVSGTKRTFSGSIHPTKDSVVMVSSDVFEKLLKELEDSMSTEPDPKKRKQIAKILGDSRMAGRSIEIGSGEPVPEEG
ncbi:hypothetical protein GCM10022222_64050 [Amycolatopsis ultiminotia]|uniref:2-oxoadipate dioxygenase/decarboxylase n=1 Tax=Amycolatopsis ultiminotia TaxID=543629 RepID=A0ABP6XTE3_9PSEU